MSCESLWINVGLATFDPRALPGDPYGIIEDAALAVDQGRILWLGPRAELPVKFQPRLVHDGKGAWITPGLVDCHTHLVYAGNRANEFEARLEGISYAEIARAGGGIAATVAATRRASLDELVSYSSARLARLVAEGVTTIEIKSGYGLTSASELQMLRAARALAALYPVHITTTLLAAHALPAEFEGRPEDYVSLVCDEMIPDAARLGLADAVDAFCETIGFSEAQTARVFDAARRFRLPVKLHADQLSDGQGAALAARFGALSADHLEYTSAAGVAALAKAKTVAVLLPGAFYFLREKQLPPIDALRREGVPIAVATDCNPGSSPCTSLLLMLNMACTLFRLTPAEALAGATRSAALALGLGHCKGRLAPGWDADLAIWQVGHPRELCYAFGSNPLIESVYAGQAHGPG
jgi:imidazolonepropionase